MPNITKTKLVHQIEIAAANEYGVSVAELSKTQMYNCLATVVRDFLLEKRRIFNKQHKAKDHKRIHYLSMEFLMGRSLKNNIFNLDIGVDVADILKQYNMELDDLYELEPDAGLGNGGLGRLAACYLDGLATLAHPSMGHCLLFDYGLFQQKIVDGWQTELPDNWLPGGKVWLKERPDKATTVKMFGEVKEIWTDQGPKYEVVGAKEVEAFPYDMVVSGYKSKGVAVLRLWRARNTHKFDIHAFGLGEYSRAVAEQAEAELITKVLYPNDGHEEGKILRLKQEYFLVSASMQNITSDHFKKYGNFSNFAEMVAVHINDTHPALAVPELMRIFIDDYQLEWGYAWDIIKNVCAYTNHTILTEALECWPEYIFQKVLPRVYQIVLEINERACKDYWDKCHDWNKVSNMAVVAYGQVRMANLSIAGSHAVNGVSQLHSDIIRKTLFADFCSVESEKFTNVTNGIAHRRWLCQSNPRLSRLITDLIGDGFIKDASKLQELNKFSDDASVLAKLPEIKLANKVDFSNLMMRKAGQAIDPNTRLDVQVKRLHEYKRQLLNVLKIVSLYHDLRENPDLDIVPQTFIFGAKAAPSYYTAKEVIKLICMISKDIEKNSKIKEKLNVVFLENYCVSMAEHLMPASEISQQISLAGKEASGTGNMKFMINGAITIGTLDGANVEMSESVGLDNIFIFGHTAREVEDMWASGYSSTDYYFKSPKLRMIIEELNRGYNGETFENISNYLLRSNHIADPYMCFADFASYMSATERMDKAYRDAGAWNKMSLRNIAESGRFAADRAVSEYVKNIWRM